MQYVSKKVIYDTLINRDQPYCGLCKESIENEIDLYLDWRSFGKFIRKRTSVNLDVDHKIPFWLVGGYKWGDIDNLHLVHKTCNKAKGGKIVLDL